MSHGIQRRNFLKGAAIASLAAYTRLSSAAPAAFAEPALEEFDYGAVQLTGGPLKQQYDRVHASYLALDNDRLLKGYRERAGMPAPGVPMGGWYSPDGFVPGHSLGQYISGLARLARTTGDPACRTKVGDLVDGFAATLGSSDRIYDGPNAEKVWPCYILDKHLCGLIDAYSLCGVEPARELIPRVFHGALPYIPQQGRDRIGKKDPPYDETYILPENLFSAYAITGDRAFCDRAIAYLLNREYFDPLARGEDVLPGRHAYSHAMALSSAGKAHQVLRDDKYLQTMKNGWHFLTTEQQYASGGWGPNETFIEPHKGQLYDSLRTTEDHFETPCGSYAATKLARYLLCATGDGRYGDNLERVVYNALLAVKEPDSDGDYPYYSSYNPSARKVYYPKKWPCCSGTLIQGVADYVKDIYFRSSDGIAVNLYAPSRLRWNQDGTPVAISQETNYPIGLKVALQIECAAPVTFSLRLRVPGWVQGSPEVRVNGMVVATRMLRAFAVVRRTWNPGDTLTLEFPQEFRTEAIDDLHENTVALMRGPLLYVELNPAEGESHLAQVGTLRPLTDAPGIFCTQKSGRTRVHLPLYFVRDESYTSYFHNS